jgi:nitrite reductase/ring-hydroxylating ferredoxin subunit
MLSPQDNELMCRVGPATGMGQVLRSYWLPALLSSDLPKPDGDPKHVQLLGEDFVAFRDTNGQVGLLDEACCHRGASLTLGLVEGCGIRCIYHGWKFAVDGTVLETPNVPDPKFKDRFKARAYPVREAGGLVWAYLGVPDKQPQFPAWPWLGIPAAHRINTVHVEACNFVQAIEGLLDSTHLGVLHANSLKASDECDLGFANKVGSMKLDLAPRIEVEDAEFGFYYAALRSLSDSAGEFTEARVTAFVAPCLVLNANGDLVALVVPASDERCNFYHLFWDTERRLGEEPLRSEHLKFVGLDDEMMDQFGVSAKTHQGPQKPSRGNRFHQDRTAMENGSFSGLEGIIEEDVAVTVSAGPLRDRSKEMLSSADVAVNRLYRTLLSRVRAVQSGGAPAGLSTNVANVTAFQRRMPPGATWRSLLPTPKGTRDAQTPAAAE